MSQCNASIGIDTGLRRLTRWLVLFGQLIIKLFPTNFEKEKKPAEHNLIISLIIRIELKYLSIVYSLFSI